MKRPDKYIETEQNQTRTTISEEPFRMPQIVIQYIRNPKTMRKKTLNLFKNTRIQMLSSNILIFEKCFWAPKIQRYQGAGWFSAQAVRNSRSRSGSAGKNSRRISCSCTGGDSNVSSLRSSPSKSRCLEQPLEMSDMSRGIQAMSKIFKDQLHSGPWDDTSHTLEGGSSVFDRKPSTMHDWMCDHPL